MSRQPICRAKAKSTFNSKSFRRSRKSWRHPKQQLSYTKQREKLKKIFYPFLEGYSNFLTHSVVLRFGVTENNWRQVQESKPLALGLGLQELQILFKLIVLTIIGGKCETRRLLSQYMQEVILTTNTARTQTKIYLDITNPIDQATDVECKTD